MHCEGNEGDRSGWYFNNIPIEQHPVVNRSGNVEVNEHLKVSILALHRINPNNEGEYSCVVKGEKFLVRMRVELTILDLAVNPPSTDAREGDGIELHCVVTGASDSSIVQDIVWYFSPRDSFSPPVPLPVSGPGALFIRKDRGFTSFISSRSARPQMDGVYYCRLRSTPGREAKGDVKICEFYLTRKLIYNGIHPFIMRVFSA
ncbi:unnamed protein product [Protopolystoma xenopodis]|uniref:Ig-like domain-containing protein n=1 Tax=Protopolystoma xenopodis TaxID=117903 RepID=A0A3S4ZFX5_9PLAT|nr:unnamed protein product [Protopolystoma xenopodis]